MNYIQFLKELDRTDLPLAGGKGANLGALIHAGLPVPPGFCVTTAGYRRFLEVNQLAAKIQEQVAQIQTDDPAELDTASKAIYQFFEQGKMPDEIIGEIREVYRSLSTGDATPAAVAVRSSATAEDLPDLSFAGQQDTYLNIVGEQALLDAVVRCWASLWTARAIGYRARNRIDQSDVALAVVVQLMVPSQAAGVLFTANPLTGKRSETVIDATLGLGEALVSGMVEPDYYVVDTTEAGERILTKTLGNKALSVRCLEGGGTQLVEESSTSAQALPDEQILELARYGRAAERFFGLPQDMEWAWAGGCLYVLQSRAITSLYPLPERKAVNPSAFEIWFSFASWQGMLKPISPLGQDTFTGLVAGIGRIFDDQMTIRGQNILLSAGERLYVNITNLVRNPTGRKIALVFTDSIDPVSAGILEELLKDPRLSLISENTSLRTRLSTALGFAPVIRSVIYNLLWPSRGRARLGRRVDELVEIARSRCAAARDFSELVTAIESVPTEAPVYLLPHLLPGIISGQVPFQVMLRLAEPLKDGPHLVYELTRGLPNNVTTEMDLKLWGLSRTIQSDPLSNRHFQASPIEQLSAEYLDGQLPPVAQQALVDFMQLYGMRSIAEIDVFNPRWKEDPRHIIQILKSYLEIKDTAASPEAVFQNGAERALQARQALIAGLRKTRFGFFKSLLARFLTTRIHELVGLRETPKFTIVRIIGVIRDALIDAGRKLSTEGKLARPDDIFFLHLWELEEFAAGTLPDAQGLIEQRRRSFERELNRKRVPRILLSDGTSYYESASSLPVEGEGILSGSPVSAGVVEGIVRVVLDPHGCRLLPGEILVCSATDPAWTPLFLAAGGLVMEIGGMMTHGSVVAREYGIPAVVGVNQATTRLKTGQHVRVDGSLGRIQLLE